MKTAKNVTELVSADEFGQEMRAKRDSLSAPTSSGKKWGQNVTELVSADEFGQEMRAKRD